MHCCKPNSTPEKMNIFANLPVELYQEFLLYIRGQDLIKMNSIFKIPKIVIDSQYFWRFKFKVEEIQDLQPHEESENFINFQKKFSYPRPMLFYKYLIEVRKIWLTKSWNDALNYLHDESTSSIHYSNEKVIVKWAREKFEILNTTTNKVILKYTTPRHALSEVIMQFPFLISFDERLCKLFVWNLEDRKLLWNLKIPRVGWQWPIFCVNKNMIGIVTNVEPQICLIELTTGKTISTIQHHGSIQRAYLCDKHLLTTTHSKLNVWDIDQQVLKYSLHIAKYVLYTIIQFQNVDDAYVICKGNAEFSYVLNLKDGEIREFETKLKYPHSGSNHLIVRKPKLIFFNTDNVLKVVNYTTMNCLIEIEKYVNIKAISANNNFIVLATSLSIVILDSHSCKELRIFSMISRFDWRNCHISHFTALDSKLVLQYTNNIFRFVKAQQLMLDFNVPL